MYSLIVLLVIAGSARSRRSCHARPCPEPRSSRSSRRSSCTRTTGRCTCRRRRRVALRRRAAGSAASGGVAARTASSRSSSAAIALAPLGAVVPRTSARTPARRGPPPRPSPRRSAGSRASSSTSPCRPRRSRCTSSSRSCASSCCSCSASPPRRRVATGSTSLLTGQPRARVLGAIAIGTLAVGWVASREAGTAFQARYSSVVFPVLVILVALGIVALPTRWLQVGVLALVSVLALWTTHWGAHVQRSQAGKVAIALHAAGARRLARRGLPRPARSLPAALRGRDDVPLRGLPEVHQPRRSSTGATTRPRSAATSPQAFAQRVTHAGRRQTVLPRLVRGLRRAPDVHRAARRAGRAPLGAARRCSSRASDSSSTSR